MVKYLIHAFCGIIASLSFAGEIVNLKAFSKTESEPVSIAQGESAKLLFITSGDHSGRPYIEIKWGDGVWIGYSPEVHDLTGMAIAGPAAIKVINNNSRRDAFAAIEIQRPTKPEVIQPLAAAVIPQDESGEYQVILESSTDTITWTLAEPGTYGGSTEKRFFRTRIIKTN